MSLPRHGRRALLSGLLAAVALCVAAPAVARRRDESAPAPRPAAKHRSAKAQVPVAPPLIVIDPGHGGQDPGAIGVTGLREKTVTLAAALELKRMLEAGGRYRVRLTRDDDTTVELSQRVAFARAQGASLLISLHADSASRNHAAHGASVYIRATNAPPRRVRARPRDIARALANEPRSRDPSSRLQAALLQSLSDDVALTPAPSREAHLYVLATGIPSVLLEMGFLSNRRDEAAMRNPAHRRVIAEAVVEAVDAYFARLRANPERRT